MVVVVQGQEQNWQRRKKGVDTSMAVKHAKKRPLSRKPGGVQGLLRVDNWTQDVHAPEGYDDNPGYEQIMVYPDPIESTRIDHWTWPYRPANTQYGAGFLSAWDGNQMPGFHKHPSADWMGEWQPIYSQYGQEVQRDGARSVTGMSQASSFNFIQMVKMAWASEPGPFDEEF
jgi:hypothetical protein